MSTATAEHTTKTPTDTPTAWAADAAATTLERRGRWWLLWSFLLCPCHLPLTLAALTAVLAGTSVGVGLREHTAVAAVAITATWLLGTGYGFHLIRQAKRTGGACPLPRP